MELDKTNRRLWDLTGFQWAILFAAWVGWGFDAFDGVLFNYVAPNCVPTLLGLKIGSPDAKSETLLWTGILTSVLLVGWGLGGIVFGRICDRIGRSRTLLLTISIYAFGTALCAASPNLAVLIVCRFVAALGIGGEWAAGASMVAEIVPEKRRVECGALLYTAAPIAFFLATFVTYQIQGVYFKSTPEFAWRYVFLCGLVPALFGIVIRFFVKEPERWKQAVGEPPRISELFTPKYRYLTISGFAMALVALLMWWSCNAFIPVVATGLAQTQAAADHLAKTATQQLVESWKALATTAFNTGGVLGTLLTIPAAKYLGRKPMFAIYFIGCAASLFTTFGAPLDPHTRLYFYFAIGLTIFGVFGSFTYYLPELFPTRLRATGAGTCYNSGRFIAAFGPFLVGMIASMGKDAATAALHVMFWVGVVPILGLLAMPWVVETKDRPLTD